MYVVTKETVNNTSKAFEYTPTRFQSRRWNVEQVPSVYYLSIVDSDFKGEYIDKAEGLTKIQSALMQTNNLLSKLSYVPKELFD